MNLHRQSPRLLRRALVTAGIACLAPGLHGCGSDAPTAPETLPQTLETVQAAVDLITNGQVLIPSSCGGSPAINCPGGSPGSPVYVTMAQTASTVAFVPAANRYDVSATLSVGSATGIPVTLPITGECTVNVDTSPGTSPTIDLTGEVRFTSLTPGGPIDRLSFSNVAVSGVEDADVSITGSFGCSVADAYIAFFAGLVADQLANAFAQGASLCAAPGPTLLEPCREQP